MGCCTWLGHGDRCAANAASVILLPLPSSGVPRAPCMCLLFRVGCVDCRMDKLEVLAPRYTVHALHCPHITLPTHDTDHICTLPQVGGVDCRLYQLEVLPPKTPGAVDDDATRARTRTLSPPTSPPTAMVDGAGGGARHAGARGRRLEATAAAAPAQAAHAEDDYYFQD
uniref:Uncharacterized protein n=1 Tax=Chlamydomonas euryale TaxID=1486919 RepID=A0A7R9VAM4_9CHLO|mmetsp:Transcript_26340/g.78233  ORF Transcript_26340/g.78233 Transcript_26340/m.78233 type:complete len:169 (+) Transcript_26340:209-715(+)